jgi:hypothetical protein
MEEDLLRDITEKHIESRKKRIQNQVIGKGDHKKIFDWTKPVLIYLKEVTRATTKDIREHLKKNYHSKYEDLPDEVFDSRIDSVLSNLVRKKSLKNVVGVDTKDLFFYDMRIEKFGNYWELRGIESNIKKERKKLLELFKSKNSK